MKIEFNNLYTHFVFITLKRQPVIPDNAGSLTYSIGDKSTMSAPSLSLYIRPYEKTPTSLVFNGYRWTLAHYLNPIAVQNFLIITENNDATGSPIYQNPGWPITANAGPTGL